MKSKAGTNVKVGVRVIHEPHLTFDEIKAKNKKFNEEQLKKRGD